MRVCTTATNDALKMPPAMPSMHESTAKRAKAPGESIPDSVNDTPTMKFIRLIRTMRLTR